MLGSGSCQWRWWSFPIVIPLAAIFDSIYSGSFGKRLSDGT